MGSRGIIAGRDQCGRDCRAGLEDIAVPIELPRAQGGTPLAGAIEFFHGGSPVPEAPPGACGLPEEGDDAPSALKLSDPPVLNPVLSICERMNRCCQKAAGGDAVWPGKVQESPFTVRFADFPFFDVQLYALYQS